MDVYFWPLRQEVACRVLAEPGLSGTKLTDMTPHRLSYLIALALTEIQDLRKVAESFFASCLHWNNK